MNTTTRRLTATTTAAAVVAGGALSASVADATLVVQKSLAGVKLGMTRAQVEAKLGKPSAVLKPKSEILGDYFELRYGLTYVSVTPGDEGGVFDISTTSKKQRTADGVGVGTSEKVLKQRVKNVKCEVGRDFRICSVGTFRPGRTVTTFRMNRQTKKVTVIQLGRVID